MLKKIKFSKFSLQLEEQVEPQPLHIPKVELGEQVRGRFVELLSCGHFLGRRHDARIIHSTLSAKHDATAPFVTSVARCAAPPCPFAQSPATLSIVQTDVFRRSSVRFALLGRWKRQSLCNRNDEPSAYPTLNAFAFGTHASEALS